MDTFKTPLPGESLKGYISRIRKSLKLTQFELAHAAGIHGRSVGKIERGLTTKLNQKTLNGLAMALGVSNETLLAVSKGEEVIQVARVKFCPRCWNPGLSSNPMWSDVKAKFCYLCGTQLHASCVNCGELVLSLRHSFCPICGHPYKNAKK